MADIYPYDIRKSVYDATLSTHGSSVSGYLRNRQVMKAIGARTNFVQLSYDVLERFATTGDGKYNNSSWPHND
jgi:hypothetical protein